MRRLSKNQIVAVVVALVIIISFFLIGNNFYPFNNSYQTSSKNMNDEKAVAEGARGGTSGGLLA